MNHSDFIIKMHVEDYILHM